MASPIPGHLELIEGESLGDRLLKGRLPMDLPTEHRPLTAGGVQ